MVTPASEFVKDLTVALAAAPVSYSVSVTSLVVNRPSGLQLSEQLGTCFFFAGEGMGRARDHLYLWDSVAPRILVECLLCTKYLALHWGWRGMKCLAPF